MEIWQAIVLGVVQGFAEFLPISSSGHLILIQRWFGITEGAFFYSVMLHIGTLIPCIVVLWKDILNLFKKPFNRLLYLIYASIPAGVVGLILSLTIDLDLLFSEHLWLLSITFLLTAGELIWSDVRCKKLEMNNGINTKTAFIMGAGQACGVLPGLSRSGSTISFGCLGKVKREENATFTFLMSLPIICAAVLLELYDGLKVGFEGVNFTALMFGTVSAMITGYIAIKFMLKIIKKANYKWFSLYLVIISIATLITYAC